MKKILLPIALVFMIGVAFGQGAKPAAAAASVNCFREWYKLFKERGADPIADGTHEVIITLRNGDLSDCFLGKIDVTGGNLSSPLSIQKMDGSYEEFDKRVSAAYQGADARVRPELRGVTNGMSESLQLEDGELIRLFFYKALRDKPKSNKRAPSPSQLVKSN